MWTFLDYLPGIIIPSVMLYFFFWVPLRRVRDAKLWRKTHCIITSSSASEDEMDSGLYRLLVTYQYEFAGVVYSSSRYSFSPSSATAGYRGKKRITERLAPGTRAFCYVNPDDPGEAVIERGVTWDMVVWGLFGIVFLVAFLFFAWHV